MAFCSNCGNELKDGAQFCSNCGQQVNQRPSTSEQPKGFVDSFKKTWKELESEEKNKSNLQSKPKNEDDGKLSKTKKFFLGWAFLVALFGVLVGFSTEEEGSVMIAISALALILIICTFVGKINSKYAWYVSLGSMLFITLLVGSGNDNKKKDTAQPASVEQKQEVTDEQQTEKEKEKTEVKEEQKKAEEKNSRSAFVGDYVYSYYIGNTNAKLYFKISLKSDGTFTFSPNNETTKTQMDIDKVMSGYDYPEGGIWEVKDTSVGKAVFLKFDCDWGEGSISANKSVIQINNMNGHTLKAPLTTD